VSRGAHERQQRLTDPVHPHVNGIFGAIIHFISNEVVATNVHSVSWSLMFCSNMLLRGKEIGHDVRDGLACSVVVINTHTDGLLLVLLLFCTDHHKPMHRRTCVICGVHDSEPAIKILVQRLAILKLYFPLAKKVFDRAHKSCLQPRFSFILE
jgi:hypothetical protein